MWQGIFFLQALLVFTKNVRAQSVTPTNSTIIPSALQDEFRPLNLSQYQDGQATVRVATIVPLTSAAASRNIPLYGVTGMAFVANPDNQRNITAKNLVFISCDPSDYVGNINAISIYQVAQESRVQGIIFYSQQAATCNLTVNMEPYTWTFSTTNRLESSNLITALGGGQSGAQSNMTLTIHASNASTPTTSNVASTATSSASSSSSGSGVTSSTTVAMIILYSITGIITASFLAIIIVGAVRAHRHPERYGPHLMAGRPRQSRARGLAKAMLDSLPIVKVAERQPAKSTEHELENGKSTLNSSVQANAGRTSAKEGISTISNVETTTPDDNKDIDGIAAVMATTSHTANALSDDSSAQGCSICTDDFEPGQDQRVLPCDHRFHPACVDPWLLNVSGTCPLCRIDLRPAGATGDPNTDDQDLPPPLAMEGALNNADRERARRRRGSVLAMLSIGRPERLNREQRLQALREYRAHIARQTSQGRAEPSSSDSTSTNDAFQTRP